MRREFPLQGGIKNSSRLEIIQTVVRVVYDEFSDAWKIVVGRRWNALEDVWKDVGRTVGSLDPLLREQVWDGLNMFEVVWDRIPSSSEIHICL